MSKVRVVPSVLAFGGWKGTVEIDGHPAAIDSLDHSKQLVIDHRLEPIGTELIDLGPTIVPI